MKALTLTQPWATLVAVGAKEIETRSWGTSYRGPLAIHAAKRIPFDAYGTILVEPFLGALQKAGVIEVTTGRVLGGATRYQTHKERLYLGCVVAICTLRDCVQIESRRPSHGCKITHIGDNRTDYHMVSYPIPPDEPELSFGDYTAGRFAWLLGDVVALPKPIPARGALGLWEWVKP